MYPLCVLKVKAQSDYTFAFIAFVIQFVIKCTCTKKKRGKCQEKQKNSGFYYIPWYNFGQIMVCGLLCMIGNITLKNNFI